MKIKHLAFALLMLQPLSYAYATTSIADEIAVLKDSAQEGDAESQYDLAVIYYTGNVAPQDYKQAFSLFTQSAEQGFAQAQHALGAMYEKGNGVQQDNKQAWAWYSVAALSGRENIAMDLSSLEKKLSPAELKQAQELAKQYHDKYRKQ